MGAAVARRQRSVYRVQIMVYRNDDLNNGPSKPEGSEPGPDEPGPEKLGPDELGPEELGADELGPEESEISFDLTYVPDDAEDERYGDSGYAEPSGDDDDAGEPYSYFEYPGPTADDIARSERDDFADGDSRGPRGQWLKSAVAVLLIFAALGLLISLVGPLAFSRDGGSVNNVFQAARVRQVVDGNTIVVDVDGRSETVRYIGISVGVQGESLHRSSRLANQSWVDGEVVILERDAQDRDSDGRLLRYVYVNNQMMNAVLVNSGLARYLPDRLNVRYNRVLLAAETAARDGRRGLWTGGNPVDDRPA